MKPRGRTTGAILIVVIVGVAVTQSIQAQSPNSARRLPTERVSLTTADGVSLVGTFYPPRTPSPAGIVVLLHAAFEERSSWHEFALAARAAGLSVLAIDFRGHGESGGERTFTAAMDADVDAALAWVGTSRRASDERISIAGASLGANLALRAAVRHREVTSVALLSPGTQLWEIGIADAVGPYGARPLLMVACDQDQYAADTVLSLAKRARGDCRCDLLPGRSHGVQMLKSNPTLRETLIDWLRNTPGRDLQPLRLW